MFVKRNLRTLVAVCVVGFSGQSCNLTDYPTTPEQFDKQACLKYRRAEWNLATNDWDQAVNMDPENPDYYWKRSRATMRFDRVQQSVDDALKSIELLGDKNPRKLIYFQLQLAEALATLGSFPEAKEAFDKALQMSEGKVDAAPVYMERGKVLLSIGDISGAIADETSAISIVPTLGRAYHLRGKAYDAAGDPSSAAKDFLKARTMGFDPAEDNWEPLPID